MRKAGAFVGTLLAWGAWAGAAAADEAKTPISAVMVMSIMSQPVTLRDPDRDRPESDPRRSAPEGVPMPDGSVRYGSGGPGSVYVTVRNPCPPGAAHYDLPPLPGRRR
jgi:hypothetical protein